MGGTPVSLTRVFEIKRLAWMHYKQIDIAALVLVDQGHISRILSGQIHSAVPFPDGTTGALPESRARAAAAYRKRHLFQMHDYITTYSFGDSRRMFDGYFEDIEEGDIERYRKRLEEYLGNTQVQSYKG